MNVPGRRCRTLLMPLVVLLAVAVFCGAASLSRSGMRLLAQSHADEDERTRELAALQEEIDRRAKAKRAVLEDVIVGRYTLLEGALLFRQADRASPHFCWEVFYEKFPGDTDEERYCRAVMTHASCRLRGNPAGAAVLRRLEAEFHDILRRFSRKSGLFP